MRFVFTPAVSGSTLNVGGRTVRAGDEVELDDAAAARIRRSSGAGCLVPAVAEPTKPVAEPTKPVAKAKKPSAKPPAPVEPEPEGDDGEPEGA